MADSQRPLSPQGRADVVVVAQRALARGVAPTAIYHSGILRARQTAELVAALLAPADGVCELAGLYPEDDPVIVKAELELTSRSILLVSHLPYLGRLAGLLVAGDGERSVVQFAPATLACMTRQAARWQLGWWLSPQRVDPS